MYNVYHHYDVDGGFGDAVSQVDLLFTTDSKEVADTFVSKYDNNHVYDVPYAKLYRGALRVEKVTVIESYEDIPQRYIQWGEENIKSKDYNESDWSLPEEDVSAESKLDTLVSLAELKQDLEYPKIKSYDVLLKVLETTRWKHTPWRDIHSYYSIEDIAEDINEISSRVDCYDGMLYNYCDMVSQKERLPHNGIVDGGMIAEQTVECKFEYRNLLFCIAPEEDKVTVLFYPAVCPEGCHLEPFTDEAWCIFYSEEDRPRRQRIK